MKHLFILFSLIIISFSVFGQSVKTKYKAKKANPYSEDCAFTNKYSTAQRSKIYPFSKAAKILAVSYEATGIRQVIEPDDGKAPAITWGLHVKNGVLDTSTLKEKSLLNISQINDLTNVIFNTKRVGRKLIEPSACFEPRNAFIFFDEKGIAFDYIEICFDCTQYQSFTKRIDIGVNCPNKFDLLKNIFINSSIKYGTIEGVEKH